MEDQGRGDRSPLFCDTNVFVRFLTADSARQSPLARRALERAARGDITIAVTDVVIAELAYVLTKVYGLTVALASERLLALLWLPGVECSQPSVVEDALGLWAEGRVDFVDAYLAALCRGIDETAVLSFDRDFDRIEGVERVDPAQY